MVSEKTTTLAGLGERALRSVLGEWMWDLRIRWLLICTLLSGTVFAALWAFVGVWAIQELRVSGGTAGVLFVFDALGGAIGGIVGGRLADRSGRMSSIAGGWLVEGGAAASLAVTGHNVVAGFGLITLASAAGGVALAGSGAVVADLVPEHKQKSAYAARRVVSNLSIVIGPPFGGLLLIGKSWMTYFVCLGLLGLLAGVVALKKLGVAGTSPASAEKKEERAPRLLYRDHIFLAFLLACTFGFVAASAFESILPIVATSSYDVSPSMWGLIAAVNPLVVVLVQVRATKWIGGLKTSLIIGAGTLVMTMPFLLLLASHAVLALIAIAAVYSWGEVLWNPTASSAVAQMAPETRRGSYMGAFGATMSVAWAVGPLIGLQLRQATGSSALWLFIASLGLPGAVLGMWATSTRRGRLQN